MNKRKVHLILSWLLLLFFAVGQLVVYAHQHHSKYNTSGYYTYHSNNLNQIVKEKCGFCDQMQHAPINCVLPVNYLITLSTVICIYNTLQHHYKGNPLVYADGLSPPSLSLVAA